MKTLNIEDLTPHSFIVMFGGDGELLKRIVESQTGSVTTVVEDNKQPEWIEDSTIQKIARSGRYDKTSLVIRLLEPKDLPTHVKYYIDYVILPQKVYRDSEKRRLLWEIYGQSIPSYESFTNLLDSHSIVIANGQAFVCVI